MIETKFIGVCNGCDKIKKVTEKNWCRKCLKHHNALRCARCKKTFFVNNSYIIESDYWLCDECYEMAMW